MSSIKTAQENPVTTAPPSPNGEGPAVVTYYQQRMHQLGITEEENQVMLWQYDMETQQNILKPIPVFKPHYKGVEIIPYTLQRSHVRIEKEGSRIKKDWSIVRLEKPIIKEDGDIIKYLMPKGHGSHLLISPNILDTYDHRQEIHTIVLTEGYFKCWKGYMAGLHIIGLPSITHMKSADKKSIHPEIIEIIEKCNVKHIIWLTDGDALDISKELETTDALGNKTLKDLYNRPNGFYKSVDTFSTLLYDLKNVRKYWAYTDIDQIIAANQNRFSRDDIKGLDDVLISFPDQQQEIVNDLLAVSRVGTYFIKFDVTVFSGKIRQYFHLDSPKSFYLHHIDSRPDLRGKNFVFHGTQYNYNDTTGDVDVVIPARAKDYFRVGDDYYKIIHKPNKYGQLEKYFKGRRKATITDDHGKEFPKHVPRYEDFCNVPNNTNFQQVIHNCFNVYSPLEYTPGEEPATEEDCPTILAFLNHIFGERTITFKHPKTHDKHEYRNIDLALDYLQILYQQPAEKLPILCLISKENNTGKSTFGYLLRTIFSGNVAIVGNQDLAGDFNAHWATKLVVICDEAKIDKQHVVEKVKSLSTANKITMNAKGKDHVELDCFIKFIFITNNEENFIYMSDEDIRYWIIKVPVIREENPSIMQNFIEEIPAFLSYLNQRTIKAEKLGRMWFHPSLLKTDAMKKVIEFSRSTVQKEIRQRIRDMFFDFGLEEIRMTRIAIHKEFFNNKHEANYIERVLKEEMKVDLYHEFDPVNKDLFGNPEKIYKTKRHSYPKWDEAFEGNAKKLVRVEVEGNGRPYVFMRQDFLTADEIKRLHIEPQTTYENNLFNNNNGTVIPSAARDLQASDNTDDLPF